MMELCALDETLVQLVYEHMMRRDFPPSELKRLEDIVRLMRAGVYDVLGAYENGAMVGYALLYRPTEGHVALLDYLAVEPEQRGRGFGSRMLVLLQKHYAAHADALMIECERPSKAPNESEARRRIRFYQYAGAQLTNVRIWLFEVEYSILVLPCKELSIGQDWAEEMLSLYRQMLPPAVYTRNVRLIRR